MDSKYIYTTDGVNKCIDLVIDDVNECFDLDDVEISDRSDWEIVDEDSSGTSKSLNSSISSSTASLDEMDEFKKLNPANDPNELVRHSKKLIVPDDSWKTIFDSTSQKLIDKAYPSVIAAELSKIVGCVINIRKKYIGKKCLTIHAYCAHGKNETDPLKKCYQFKLMSNDISCGHFDIFYNNVTRNHADMMTRQLRQFDRDNAKERLRTMSSEQYKEQCVAALDQNMAKNFQNAQKVKSQSTIRKVKSEIYTKKMTMMLMIFWILIVR